MLKIIPYDRFAGVSYAHRWAYERNPKYMNFDELGGDCTNFASQCLYAGAGVMNFTPTMGEDRNPIKGGVVMQYEGGVVMQYDADGVSHYVSSINPS